MKKKILVTGAMGFVGRSLLPALQHAFPACEVIALTRQESDTLLGFLTYRCDLRDASAVSKMIVEIRPDYVINLAAISHIPTSFDNPTLTWNVNLQGVLNLLEALSLQSTPCTFLQVGSGDCYGKTFAENNNVDEDSPLQPLNPYSSSKAAADIASYSYSRHSHLTIIRARPFNHSGANQSADFVIGAFAQQIARIEAGLQPPVMSVGNLDAQRCFLHLDDVINAYILLLKHSATLRSGDAFNIAADTPVSIQEILDRLLEKSTVEITVSLDPKKQRPTDIPLAKGNCEHLKRTTQWQPQISLNALLEEVLQAQRTLCKRAPSV